MVTGADPVTALEGLIPSTAKSLAKERLSIRDIGAFEINEAFPSMPLAWLRETGVDCKRMNSNSGAMALGHQIGGSGARLMTTLIHHKRENGIRHALQSMCEGCGMANATTIALI